MGKTYRRNSEKRFKDFRSKSKPSRLKIDKPKRKLKNQINFDDEV